MCVWKKILKILSFIFVNLSFAKMQQKFVHCFPFIVVFITINNEHFKFICLFFLITFSSKHNLFSKFTQVDYKIHTLLLFYKNLTKID